MNREKSTSSKYKIAVYAISKNEEQFVDRWYNSIKDADGIFVLDTGSTDKTVEKLKEHGITVKQEIIDPWRFDVARNRSLQMVPSTFDICICIDLDEVLLDGWKEELLKIWNDNTTRCEYIYNWKLDKNNIPEVSFHYEKIHKRKNFKWIYPVHEILKCDHKENYVKTEKIILNHYPDSKKERSSYLPLLELSVKEDPNSDRNRHYLGREYMYYEQWHNAIDTLISHINMPNSTWKDERCASMRFIGRCYTKLKRYKEANMWLEEAIKEAPYLRDPYMEIAFLYYELKDWKKVKKYCLKALKIPYNQRSYINEVFTKNSIIYDLLSLSYFYLQKPHLALKYINLALKENYDDTRLLNNKILIKKALQQKK